MSPITEQPGSTIRARSSISSRRTAGSSRTSGLAAYTFHGYFTEAYELTGDGRADIFVDGVVIHATWHHPDPNVPAVYLDANGDPIELDNGLTWVHVIGSQKWHGVG